MYSLRKDMEMLSFVAKEGHVLDMWSVQPKGNFFVDAENGRKFAEELVKLTRKHENPHIIGHVLKRIAETGDTSGQVVGFANALGLALLTQV